MPDDPITIEFDPPDLPQRFKAYPNKFNNEMLTAMRKVLYHLQDSVPSYPPKPATSKYRRTGTLGRSLTVGGPMSITERKKIGPTSYESALGTRVKYAKYVIGNTTQAHHMGHWWKIEDAGKKAAPGVRLIIANTMRLLADWIAGKGA